MRRRKKIWKRALNPEEFQAKLEEKHKVQVPNLNEKRLLIGKRAQKVMDKLTETLEALGRKVTHYLLDFDCSGEEYFRARYAIRAVGKVDGTSVPYELGLIVPRSGDPPRELKFTFSSSLDSDERKQVRREGKGFNYNTLADTCVKWMLLHRELDEKRRLRREAHQKSEAASEALSQKYFMWLIGDTQSLSLHFDDVYGIDPGDETRVEIKLRAETTTDRAEALAAAIYKVAITFSDLDEKLGGKNG